MVTAGVDAANVEAALTAAVNQHGVTLGDTPRARLLDLLQQLDSLDFGDYARGYTIQELEPGEVRLLAASSN